MQDDAVLHKVISLLTELLDLSYLALSCLPFPYLSFSLSLCFRSGVSKLFATGARFSIVKVVGANLFTYSNDNLRKFLEATLCFTFAFCFNFNILRMFLVHLKQAYHRHLNIHLTFFLKQK